MIVMIFECDCNTMITHILFTVVVDLCCMYIYNKVYI